MHTHTHTRRICSRTQRNVRTHVYALCMRMCAHILKKLFLVVLYYLVSFNFNFHKDPSFGGGDISKTIRMLISSLICIYSKFEHKSSTQVWKLHESCWSTWKLYNKMSGYQWKYGINFSSYGAFAEKLLKLKNRLKSQFRYLKKGALELRWAATT